MEMDGRYVISSHDIPNSDENKTSIKELPTHKPLIIPRQTKALSANDNKSSADEKTVQSPDVTQQIKQLEIPPIKPRPLQRKVQCLSESDMDQRASISVWQHSSPKLTAQNFSLTNTSSPLPAAETLGSEEITVIQNTKRSETEKSVVEQEIPKTVSEEYSSYSDQSAQVYRMIPTIPTEQYIDMAVGSKTTTCSKSLAVVTGETKSYLLETFLDKYPLPQLVSVTEGHYGLTEDFSMSEGMELILFFKKTTQAVIAVTECETDPYHIPLNCSLQFSPYQSNAKEHLMKSYYYKTVDDLLNRTDDLPKVVKVLTPYKTNKQTVLRADELIFPKRITGHGKKRTLECTTLSKRKIKLELSCAAGFSTNPSDTKMYLIEYVEHINQFPNSVMVFSDKERSETFSHIHTGMEFTFLECKFLHSCICTTDVYGELNYPLLEILTAMPIEIKISDNPNISMAPIYDTVKRVYQTFNLSMVESSMLLTDNDEQSFYEEMIKDDGTIHVYDLERPEDAFAHMGAVVTTKQNLVTPKLHFKLRPPIQINQPTTSPCSVPNSWPSVSQLTTPPGKQGSEDLSSPTSPDENRTYLRSLDVDSVLRVLDKMNLGQYKDTFQQNNINGKTLLSYTKMDLEELGIEMNIHQKRLLKLISGISSYRLK